MTVPDVLRFITGSSAIPSWGFGTHIAVKFTPDQGYARVSTASFAMGTPPLECDIHFDDTPEIQEMVGSSALMMPRRSWERNI